MRIVAFGDSRDVTGISGFRNAPGEPADESGEGRAGVEAMGVEALEGIGFWPLAGRDFAPTI